MNLDAILELSREAAAAGEFEAACHLLMAAVHLADHIAAIRLRSAA